MGHIEVTRLQPTMASRKLQVLEFVERYWEAHGAGPSISETAQAVGCTRSRAQKLITRLVRDEQLHRIDGLARGVRPADAMVKALRLLRERGYVVNEDVFAIDLPATLVLDVDESGELVLRGGWTNAPLPPGPARAQVGRLQGGAGHGEEIGSGGSAA